MKLLIAKAKGIPIYLHWSFALVLLWAGYNTWKYEGGNWNSVMETITLVLALFGCVILHELGHSMAARRYGIGTRDIVMYPIGGVAMLNNMPENPHQELVVAIAGPMVNVIIAAILGIVYLGVGLPEFWQHLLISNIFLVLFNLIPAFPMDGGRVLRALLAMRLERETATRYAMYVGRFFAIIFMLTGFYYNPFLIFIGLMVFRGAGNEYNMVKSDAWIDKHSLSDVLRKQYTSFSPNETVAQVIAVDRFSKEGHYVIVDEGNMPVGVLIRDDWQDKAPNTPLADLMNTEIYAISHKSSLDEIIRMLEEVQSPLLPVIDSNGVIGVIDVIEVIELLKKGEVV